MVVRPACRLNGTLFHVAGLVVALSLALAGLAPAASPDQPAQSQQASFLPPEVTAPPAPAGREAASVPGNSGFGRSRAEALTTGRRDASVLLLAVSSGWPEAMAPLTVTITPVGTVPGSSGFSRSRTNALTTGLRDASVLLPGRRRPRRPKVRAAVFLLSALLLGCQFSHWGMPGDRSILTDDPCAAPCWQGIVPGQTTIDEALAILDTLGVDYMRFDNEVQWHSESYYRDDGFAYAGNVLSGPGFGDSTSVTLLRMGLEFELTLQEVLDKYGPPTKFQAYRVELPTLPDGHVDGIVVSFFYPERGVIFQAWLHGMPPASIESDTTLKAVHYFAPTTMEQLFVQVPRMKTYLRGDTWKNLQDWQGLGRIPEVH